MGLMRASALAATGISRVALGRMVESGKLQRVARGIYAPANFQPTEHHGLATVAALVPGGVICLLSALLFHRLGTQAPYEVWMAIDRKAHRPTIADGSLRIVRFSARALTDGVQLHVLEGVSVKITSPARTVADCFKYRNKIGIDVALEALREYRRAKHAIDDLVYAAHVVRVGNVIRPYLEAIVS